jgi:hypothetical protein
MNRIACFASLSILLAASGALAQSNSVRGKVRSTAGTVINGAIVELRMAGGAGVLGQTATHADGDFVFSGLSAGEYEIAVTMTGFDPTVQVVRFNHAPRENFQEVINVEVTIRPVPDHLLAGPGTNFVQDVPRAAREAYEKGVGKLSEGKSAEGIALLGEAVGIFDQYFNAHYRLALEFYRAGQLNRALESLERARQINDRDGGVYHLFGLVMLRQQKFAVAEYAFGEAVRLAPNSIQPHFYRGLALIEIAVRRGDEKQRTGDLAESEKELKSALDLSGKRLVNVYLALARVHEAQGNKESAITDLESYLKADPGSKQSAAIREALARLRAGKGETRN